MTRISLLSLGLAAGLSATAAAGPRTKIRFDDHWKFFREATPTVVADHYRWQWKPADVTSLDADTVPDLANGWQSAKVGQNVFNGNGFAWFQTDLGSQSFSGKWLLHFEAVDDSAEVFLNGIKVLPKHLGWNEPFDVPIDGAWHNGGPNRLVVLVENTGGGGGIMGPVSLQKVLPPVEPKPARIQFDDRGWRTVHLPHDYVVEGTFTPTADASHGSLPTPTAWYRKSFALPKSYQGKSLWIDFDGIYRDSLVYFNGHLLGHHPSGYIGVRYDLSKFAKYGANNVIAVHVDPRQGEGWWYEGGGIYRHVWLTVAEPTHLGTDSIYVQPHPLGKEGTPHTDSGLTLSSTVENRQSQPKTVTVTERVFAPSGLQVWSGRQGVTVPANGNTGLRITGILRRAELWSIENPNRYRLVTTLSDEHGTLDQIETKFGVRTLRFDANKGFFLNGKSVKLKGTCNHQDHAGVGIAIPDGLFDWRIRKLKEMGSNAYRCSHNPPAAELLEACDRLGMVVMDETRHLGDTSYSKTPSGTKADDLSELRTMILRDRNHPSIIMWSMANEEGLQGSEEGMNLYSKMKAVAKKLDPSRPVSSAMNGDWGKGFTLVEDLQGGNYNPGGYDGFHRAFPKMPFFGSEVGSTTTTRGIYADDKVKGYVTAYDTFAPPWAQTAQVTWSSIGERPFVAGGFVWTGFDYKGEPTPYGWPCVNSHFGILDICGFPKDIFYYYQAWWGGKPLVHILPHWNWKGSEGKNIDVWTYSNGDQVELFLNGKSLGMRQMLKFGHAEWQVPYHPGRLEAHAFRAGKLIAVDRVETTGPAAAIRLKTIRPTLIADNEDVSPVEVEVVDAKGRVVPTAANFITFKTSGGATVAGVGNGDPSCHEPDRASRRSAFNGRAMAIVQAGSRPGPVTVTASGAGIRSATLRLTVVPTTAGK